MIEWQNLGLIPYRDAWRLQDELREQRAQGLIRDRLLLLEHPPVFTLGKQKCEGDFLSSPESIARDGIEIIKTNRGGRITYHGPGQLVGYFICELASFGAGIKEFVRMIEQTCIDTLADFGIAGMRDEHHPGIWLGTKKIAALGLNVSHGVTQHGFAINVDCDLSPYRHIVACGIKGRGVTSMAIEKRAPVSIQKISEHLIHHAGRIFSRRMHEMAHNQLDQHILTPALSSDSRL